MTEKTIIVPPGNGANGHDANYRLTIAVPKRRFLSYLRERWWVVMICVATAVLGVVAFETVRQETYESYAQLYITLAPQLNSSTLAEPRDDFATQIELLKGARLRNAAMERLGPETTAHLKGDITVDVVRPVGTSILQVKVTSTDPEVSRQFLANLIGEYKAFKKETKLNSVDDLVATLEDDMKVLEPQLKHKQEDLTAFEKKNDIALKEQQAATANVYLSDQRRQLQQYLMDQQVLNLNQSDAESLVPDQNQPQPAAATNAALAPAADAGQAPATVASALSTNSPAAAGGSLSMLQSDAALKTARVQLVLDRQRRDQILAISESRAEHEGYNQKVTNDMNEVAALEAAQGIERKERLQELDKRIALTRTNIASTENLLRDANDLIAQARDLRTDIQRQQGFYESLATTMRNADLGKTMESERVTLYQEPSRGTPERRNLPLRIFLAVIGGLAVSMGSVFGWHLIDDRFVSVRDVKDQFGESVLGIVPQIKVPRKQAARALLAARDPRPHYAESYRHLRSALLLSSMNEGRPQTLLLTGATTGEGKTTVAVNLARVLARSGLRVALVDADPYHPVGIHALLGVPEMPGVLDFLRGDVQVHDIFQTTDEPNLTFISSGTHKEHAEGLFLRPQLADLLSALRQDRDFIILDGAPILGSDNSALLVPHVDAVVLVARPFFTRAQQLRHALEMLYQRQARTVTIVFNRARADDLSSHYATNGMSVTARNGTA